MKRFFAPLLLLPLLARAADGDWPTYLGDKASSHYSALKQLTPRNVAKLEVAWTFNAGGADKNNRSQIQCNPLVVDGVLYGTTPDLQAFALDAATGRELWRFDPASVKGVTKAGVNRGVVFWSEGNDRRVLYANDHFLHALNAITGERIASFGEGGSAATSAAWRCNPPRRASSSATCSSWACASAKAPRRPLPATSAPTASAPASWPGASTRFPSPANPATKPGRPTPINTSAASTC
jgi:glucose dehydrogenase